MHNINIFIRESLTELIYCATKSSRPGALTIMTDANKSISNGNIGTLTNIYKNKTTFPDAVSILIIHDTTMYKRFNPATKP